MPRTEGGLYAESSSIDPFGSCRFVKFHLVRSNAERHQLLCTPLSTSDVYASNGRPTWDEGSASSKMQPTVWCC